MIAAVIALGGVAVVLAVVLGVIVHLQAREREAWSGERHALVDRAIARHVGEVIAMDKVSANRELREHPERPQAVGMS